MSSFRIVAKREIHYEFEVKADSREEAIEELKRIDESEDPEEYAFQWQPFQIVEFEVDEDESDD